MLTATEGDDTPETAQIFGFVVAGDLRIKPETLCTSFRELARETGDQLSPNMVVILSGGLVNWGNLRKERVLEPKWYDDKKTYVLSETIKDNVTVEPTWCTEGEQLQVHPRRRTLSHLGPLAVRDLSRGENQ